MLLAAIGLPALVAALIPDHPTSAEATVLTSGPATDAPATTAAPTTDAAPTSTSGTSATTTAKPTSTTAKAAPTTTKAPTTTTTTKAAATANTPQPGAPAPAPPPPPVATGSGATAAEQATLACIRRRESGGNYQVVGGGGMYFGAYQFLQSSWDSTARHAGRGDLVGLRPSQASPADQDAMALALYRWQGSGPWGGACG